MVVKTLVIILSTFLAKQVSNKNIGNLTDNAPHALKVIMTLVFKKIANVFAEKLKNRPKILTA
jgi:hypothetical protein